MYNTEEDYPFAIKPNRSILGSNVEIEPGRGYQIGFVQHDTLRDLLGFKPSVLHEKYNLSPNPVDILLIDDIFVETEFSQGIIFQSRLAGLFHTISWGYECSPGY